MGLYVRRVPLDFSWPVRKVWEGFLIPDSLEGNPCTACNGDGFSPHVERLSNLWHGRAPFSPENTGSTPLRPDTPAVRALAEQHVADDPERHGVGENAILAEARRLADLWNSMWCHHLSQEDVNALAAADLLPEFTVTVAQEKLQSGVKTPSTPSAEQVNLWFLQARSPGGRVKHVVIRARCEREGLDYVCPTCGGHGSLEAYQGQREEAADWKPKAPPTGDGWQLWETTSDGSPISPVFPDAERLAQWLTTPEGRDAWPFGRTITVEEARGLIDGTLPLTIFDKNQGGQNT